MPVVRPSSSPFTVHKDCSQNQGQTLPVHGKNRRQYDSRQKCIFFFWNRAKYSLMLSKPTETLLLLISLNIEIKIYLYSTFKNIWVEDLQRISFSVILIFLRQNCEEQNYAYSFEITLMSEQAFPNLPDNTKEIVSHLPR